MFLKKVAEKDAEIKKNLELELKKRNLTTIDKNERFLKFLFLRRVMFYFHIELIFVFLINWLYNINKCKTKISFV